MSFMFATHFHEISQRDEIISMDRLALKHMTVRYDQLSQELVYDRKLQDGPGKSLYGLEVCKFLKFPEELIENAITMRNKYNPNVAEQSILSLVKKSNYSHSKKKIFCESCKTELAVDIDHIREQSESNNSGYIEGFHKNHPANLQGLCKACHIKKTNAVKKGKTFKRVKTLNKEKGHLVTEQ